MNKLQRVINSYVSKNVQNKYIVTSILGEGAFGIVFAAHSSTEKEQKKQIAIKCFKQNNTKAGIHSTTLREVALLQYLTSQFPQLQIVKLVEIVIGDGLSPLQLSLVFEYYPHTLRSVLKMKETTVLNFNTVIQYMKQLLQTVKVLHENHIWHRDIKPENILLDADRRVCYLADFGLSKIKSYFRVHTHHVATCEYRAHELFFDYDKYDGAAMDIWSLGVLFIELLSGTNPFMAANSEMKIIKQMYSILGPPVEFFYFQSCLFPREERLLEISSEKKEIYYDCIELNNYFQFAKDAHQQYYSALPDNQSKHKLQQQFATISFKHMLQSTTFTRCPTALQDTIATLIASMLDYNIIHRISAANALQILSKINLQY